LKLRVLAGLALLCALVAVLTLLGRERSLQRDEAGRRAGQSFVAAGPESCVDCHAGVVAEWQQSRHAVAFTNPEVRAPDQSDNFRRAECLPCHAPAPIFRQGITEDSRVIARTLRRVDGVDCLSCHLTDDGRMAATRPDLPGACRPLLKAELSTPAMCQACHNQHGTHDEWKLSPAAAAGQDCADCHMPRVSRTGDEAGAPRSGRSHRFPGGRDAQFALAGLDLQPRFTEDGATLVVELTNRFAAHNLPTDSRNRALDLVVTLLDARGLPLPPARPEAREPGCETGTARLRLRNPYRQSGDVNTQLPAGATVTLSVPLPPEAVAATVALHYKLSPWVPDVEAHWSHVVELPLRADAGDPQAAPDSATSPPPRSR